MMTSTWVMWGPCLPLSAQISSSVTWRSERDRRVYVYASPSLRESTEMPTTHKKTPLDRLQIPSPSSQPLKTLSKTLPFKLIFIGVQLLYNVVLISAGPQSESVIHVHTSTPFWISFPFRSPQSTEQSSLSSTVCSHWWSILYTVSIVHMRQSQSPNSSHPSSPLGVRIFVLYLCVIIPALQIRSPIPFWHTSYLLSEHACYSLLNRKFPEDMCLFCLYLSTHSAQYDTDKVGSEYLLKEKTKDKLRSFVPGEEALLKV